MRRSSHGGRQSVDVLSTPDAAPAEPARSRSPDGPGHGSSGADADTKSLIIDDARSVLSAAGLRWALSFAVTLSLYVGAAVLLMRPKPEVVDGNPTDAINIEMVSDPSTENDKPDDAPGPKVVESAAPTNDRTQADDPEPPAPDSTPPTEAKRKPDKAPEIMPPAVHADADAVLPPPEKELEMKTPELKPEEKNPQAKEDIQERKTAPSRASTGSAALLSGGRRPSAAAKATWGGEVGKHLIHNRRYPQEARSRGWQGVARVRVTIDSEGHVLDEQLVKSSGQSILDGEALELMHRSDPFPKPPPGMPEPIVMTVPVNFAIH